MQSKALQFDAPVVVSFLQLPSLPINPEHPRVYAYELHADSTLTQPLPVVTHPAGNVLHAVFVSVVEVGASVHARALQAVDPMAVLVQGPSLPIIPVHPV